MRGMNAPPRTEPDEMMDRRLCFFGDLRVFSQWPSGTWQGSSRAGLRKERPSIWSTMPPGETAVKSRSLTSLQA